MCGTTITAKYKSRLDYLRFCKYCGVRRYGWSKNTQVVKKCIVCGEDYKVKKSHAPKRETCSMKCAGTIRWKKIGGNKHPRWREIKKIPSVYFYKRVKIPGGYQYEHRYVMEQHLGRKLERNEIVHHINEDPKDNRIENLRLMTNSEHMKLHYKF